ncbi:GNAT family N-acetyltransferase [Caldimonas brevitalea]|uniref:GCN5 family acetyltransferase n=1 Tax=Caldimonas brevitalea TaxID=413882 RepID=A0A0G3BQ17_9BURK|nr:GNAT family N-acetyltransferase [Caldimonas brevitalea]AKJ31512.1 GCN5 family acetyltransferase [Caldimonas brevitalea]
MNYSGNAALSVTSLGTEGYERPGQGEPKARPYSWVPIRSLAPRHRGRILTHLLSLSPEDRYLRFGYTARDEQVEKYVQSLDFERDEVFGVFNRRLQLIAVAHLAYDAPQQIVGRPAMVEFGVSVSPCARGRGLGARLFDRAVMHARNRRIDTLYIHALSENTAMLKIARNAGAKVQRDGSESEAYLQLPPDTLATHLEQMFEHQAAEVDYRLKVNARRFNALLEGFAEIKAGIGARRRSSIE